MHYRCLAHDGLSIINDDSVVMPLLFLQLSMRLVRGLLHFSHKLVLWVRLNRGIPLFAHDVAYKLGLHCDHLEVETGDCIGSFTHTEQQFLVHETLPIDGVLACLGQAWIDSALP